MLFKNSTLKVTHQLARQLYMVAIAKQSVKVLNHYVSTVVTFLLHAYTISLCSENIYLTYTIAMYIHTNFRDMYITRMSRMQHFKFAIYCPSNFCGFHTHPLHAWLDKCEEQLSTIDLLYIVSLNTDYSSQHSTIYSHTYNQIWYS